MKVLLIDDDEFFRKFYVMKLTQEQIQVDVAKDGQEGLELMRKTKPDVVLLDLIMPKVDGFAFLTEFSKDEELKKTPVIVFSTLSQKADKEKALSLGAVDSLDKSLTDFSVVLEKIKSYSKQ